MEPFWKLLTPLTDHISFPRLKVSWKHRKIIRGVFRVAFRCWNRYCMRHIEVDTCFHSIINRWCLLERCAWTNDEYCDAEIPKCRPAMATQMITLCQVWLLSMRNNASFHLFSLQHTTNKSPQSRMARVSCRRRIRRNFQIFFINGSPITPT